MKYKYCGSFPEYANFKDDLMEYKCLCCNKNNQHNVGRMFKERFFNKCKFPSHDNNKFILSLSKRLYPYEYMDDWEKFEKTSLPEKEDFYSQMWKIWKILLMQITCTQKDYHEFLFKVIHYC